MSFRCLRDCYWKGHLFVAGDVVEATGSIPADFLQSHFENGAEPEASAVSTGEGQPEKLTLSVLSAQEPDPFAIREPQFVAEQSAPVVKKHAGGRPRKHREASP